MSARGIVCGVAPVKPQCPRSGGKLAAESGPCNLFAQSGCPRTVYRKVMWTGRYPGRPGNRRERRARLGV